MDGTVLRIACAALAVVFGLVLVMRRRRKEE
jgi:hypothetical protein